MADQPKIDFGKIPFEFTKLDTHGVLKFSGSMDADLTKEFEKRIRPKLEGFSENLLIDLQECEEFHPAWTRLLMQIAMQVGGAGKRLRVVSTNDTHKTFFQEQGVADRLPIVLTTEIAIRELTEKKPNKLDVSFINPFLEGTIEVLKTQAKIGAKSGAPAPKDPKAPWGGEVSGVIELDSETFSGSVTISFPAAALLKIASKMTGGELTELTPEVTERASQLLNLISAHAKRILDENGHKIKMSPPTIAQGKDASPGGNATGPRLSIPFESDAGGFTVEICIGG